jgi:hypothetical protein
VFRIVPDDFLIMLDILFQIFQMTSQTSPCQKSKMPHKKMAALGHRLTIGSRKPLKHSLLLVLRHFTQIRGSRGTVHVANKVL